MAILVGIDPGKSTGLCAMRGRTLLTGGVADDYPGIHEFIFLWQPEMIILEDFYGGIMRNSRDPLKVIGVVEYICQMDGIPLIMQSPSILQSMKPRVHDMHSDRHVRSAIAHVLRYLDRLER